MKLLLHACCGPCACYPTEQLTAAGTDLNLALPRAVKTYILKMAVRLR